MIETLEARRLLNGDLDTTFGDGGRVFFRFGGHTQSHATAVQSDGKILVAGSGAGNAFLARFNADGSTDTTFDVDGLVKIDLGGEESFNQIALLAGGKILVGGTLGADNSTTAQSILALYDSNGALDTSFGGGDGIFVGVAGSGVAAMAVDASHIFTASFGVLQRHALSTGALDSSFGTGGSIDIAAVSDVKSIELDYMAVSPTTGDIALEGFGVMDDAVQETLHGGLSNEDINLLVLLNSAGTPKASFDSNGVEAFFNNPGPVAFSPADNSLLSATMITDQNENESVEFRRFSSNGTYTTAVGGGTQPNAIVFDSGNKPILASVFTGIVATRFNTDGTLDASYSQDGSAFDPLSDQLAKYASPPSTAAAINSSGQMVFATYFSPDGNSGPGLLVRFKANPTGGGITPTLGQDGTLTINGTDDFDNINITAGPNSTVHVVADNQSFDFAVANVHKIVAALGAGGDSFSDVEINVPCSVQGQDGNDFIEASNANNTLDGGAGDDTLVGGTGADDFHGGDGFDQVNEGQGSILADQTLSLDDVANDGTAGEGDNIHTDIERIDAGEGNDLIIGDSANNILNGYGGNDTISAGGGNDRIDTGSGAHLDDYVNCGSGNDTVTGNSGGTVRGGAGNDTIETGGIVDGDAGNDKLLGSFLMALGGDGNDLLDGSGAPNNGVEFHGGGGDDTLNGGTGADGLFGEDGNDILRGGAGVDRLDGGNGNDRLYGNDGNDVILGGAGADRLYGDTGDDSLDGGSGNDVIDLGPGSDTALGQSGNDRFTGVADGSADHLFGASGRDSADGSDVADVLASIEVNA